MKLTKADYALMRGEALTEHVTAAQRRAEGRRGKGNAASKLTEKEVLYIKEKQDLVAEVDISAVINNDRKAEGTKMLSRQCIRHVINGTTWSWLVPDTADITFKESSDG